MIALAAALLLASVQSGIEPEECLVRRGAKPAATATFNGKTYAFSKAGCREQFLADPERYAQLYDALAEMAAAGELRAPAPREASLVPS
jgi:YHS domain-containing protein